MTPASTQTNGQRNANAQDTKRWALPLIAPFIGLLIAVLFITPM